MKNSIKVKLLGLGLVSCMSLGLMGCSANSIENEIDEKVESIIQSNVERGKKNGYYDDLCAIEDVKVNVEEGENVYTININLIRNNDTNEEFTIETLDKNLENIKSFEDFKVIDIKKYESGELAYRDILYGYEYLLDGEDVKYLRELAESDKLHAIDKDSLNGCFETALGFWTE